MLTIPNSREKNLKPINFFSKSSPCLIHIICKIFSPHHHPWWQSITIMWINIVIIVFIASTILNIIKMDDYRHLIKVDYTFIYNMVPGGMKPGLVNIYLVVSFRKSFKLQWLQFLYSNKKTIISDPSW
jgi:hypothetical protein